MPNVGCTRDFQFLHLLHRPISSLLNFSGSTNRWRSTLAFRPITFRKIRILITYAAWTITAACIDVIIFLLQDSRAISKFSFDFVPHSVVCSFARSGATKPSTLTGTLPAASKIRTPHASIGTGIIASAMRPYEIRFKARSASTISDSLGWLSFW